MREMRDKVARKGLLRLDDVRTVPLQDQENINDMNMEQMSYRDS